MSHVRSCNVTCQVLKISTSQGVCPVCQKQMGPETEDKVKIGKKELKVLIMQVLKGVTTSL